MKLSHAALFALAFTIVAALLNHELWFSRPWLFGLTLGLVAAVVITTRAWARRLFAILGALLLLTVAVGGVAGMDHSGRALFAGASLGLVAGLVSALFLTRSRSTAWLSKIAEFEDDALLRRIAKLLGGDETH
ncbi:hypothetical protein E4T66_17310 [Sinimarinibacterium sp. CAU 1509]|uniref:hypothetical protein n=1 Tax=Sinimarinibacterium sp. CAU 1509 TaxID=2562283 RepID=UPI0010ACC052|nr:hypothetical protein [Sinimarinibacterium sp. CAU 1509]TJY57169.1 hypothetical protein E4T66_17310 [Sinimarinibacterium sp. CAU 1509]